MTPAGLLADEERPARGGSALVPGPLGACPLCVDRILQEHQSVVPAPRCGSCAHAHGADSHP